MNEYLGTPGKSFGSPNFTDVFPSHHQEKYRDSKLSHRGVAQAQSLHKLLGDLNHPKRNVQAQRKLQLDDNYKDIVQQLDLVVCSPLSRALHTFEIGLQPHLPEQVPIVALPLASERLYLISDIGKRRSELAREFQYCDFEIGFQRNSNDELLLDEEWWFGLDDCPKRRSTRATPTGITYESYVEWRPNSQNQEYACPGEPDEPLVGA
jgi:hypothetical protein